MKTYSGNQDSTANEQPASQAVAEPSVSAEAIEAARMVIDGYFRGGISLSNKPAEDLAVFCQRAIDAATEKLRAELRELTNAAGIEAEDHNKTMERLIKANAELSLLHESHDALAKEVEGLRKDKARLIWCQENEIQFGVQRGSPGYNDCWIVYQKNRWDLPLGEGETANIAIDAAMTAQKGRAL